MLNKKGKMPDLPGKFFKPASELHQQITEHPFRQYVKSEAVARDSRLYKHYLYQLFLVYQALAARLQQLNQQNLLVKHGLLTQELMLQLLHVENISDDIEKLGGIATVTILPASQDFIHKINQASATQFLGYYCSYILGDAFGGQIAKRRFAKQNLPTGAYQLPITAAELGALKSKLTHLEDHIPNTEFNEAEMHQAVTDSFQFSIHLFDQLQATHSQDTHHSCQLGKLSLLLLLTSLVFIAYNTFGNLLANNVHSTTPRI